MSKATAFIHIPMLVLLAGITALASAATMRPVVFAPGAISAGAHDSAPAFDPSGKVVYFGRSSPVQSVILVSRLGSDGKWSQPEIAPFSGRWHDMEPAMSTDGGYLVFVSNRPDRDDAPPVDGHFNGNRQKGGRLWRVDRHGDGWGTPHLLPAQVNVSTTVFAPSIAGDGSLYFMTPDSASGKFRLFRAQAIANGFAAAVALPFSDGRQTDVDPAVAPDESFLVFGSGRIAGRSIDLFVVFRDGKGWGTPIPLGDDVNSPGSDAEPRLAPDGQQLYFSSERSEPVVYPRTRQQAERDLARMNAGDNGNYNIWQVPLTPLLEHARQHKVN
ncbi:MAG: PD40 domain-containing protein [Proteobacteria bacterium]|nr:PD40 domain-containing protein [Pseudomonadota bacterium]